MSAMRIARMVVPNLALSLFVAVPLATQESPNSFTNLRVLPENIPEDSLFALMASFTRALGVRCTYCHVGEEGQPFRTIDFSADDRETKRKARTMLRMVQHINGEHLADLESRRDPPIRVECATCHRGINEPRMLQDILIAAYRAGGIDSTITTYMSLRERYYGRYTYDFSSIVLPDVVSRTVVQSSLDDAERLLELNVEMHPTSVFAQRQHATLAIGRAFQAEPGFGLSVYGELKERYGDRVFVEALLNGVGYALLRNGDVDAAIEAFRLNVREYPEASNPYDSLGEAYMVQGDVAQAIRNYERSLALDPENTNAIEKLQELRRRR